ncbi:TRAP transporter substrate-binding protein DctP [Marinicellulosiphila megalodicopiae]|uniref:TRAP transporter substrate-binding protein DctP n=1 Tax=Marinicellulosiphila megalodicopiae TaxID=2724896 RepID=UPI003BB1CBEC
MKNILLVGALLTSFIAPITQAATKVKIATQYPDGTYSLIQLRDAAKQIKERTEGRVEIKLYPGGVQGGNTTVLKKINKGLLGGAMLEGGAFAADYADSQVYNAPMFFNGYDEVDAVRAELDSVIESGLSDAGWNTFGLIEGGFAYAMTNNPVTSVTELKQQKLWLPSNDPLVARIAQELEISPIYLGIGEVLTSLQTNSINAIVAPPVAALALQWFSKVKYVTDVPFMYTYGTLAISDKIFNKISAEDQIIVREVLTAAVVLMDEDSRKENLKAFDALASQNIKSIEPTDEQKKALAIESQGAIKALIEGGEFSQQIFDQMKSIVEKHRAL